MPVNAMRITDTSLILISVVHASKIVLSASTKLNVRYAKTTFTWVVTCNVTSARLNARYVRTKLLQRAKNVLRVIHCFHLVNNAI